MKTLLIVFFLLITITGYSQSIGELKSKLKEYKLELDIARKVSPKPNPKHWEKVNQLALEICAIRDSLMVRSSGKDLKTLKDIKWIVIKQKTRLPNGKLVNTVAGNNTNINKVIRDLESFK